MYTIIKKSISTSGKFWLTLNSQKGGFISKPYLAQVTEEMFNSLEIGKALVVPQNALLPIDKVKAIEVEGE